MTSLECKEQAVFNYPMSRVDSLIVGNVYVVVYKDASYLNKNIDESKIPLPPYVVSMGRLRRKTDEYIDLGLTWPKERDAYVDGCIIPRKAIVKTRRLYETEQ